MSDNPIMNIGDLAKPATTLIEKLADAGYILYEPTRIKRRAKAEAEAALIQAESEIDIDNRKHRAAHRLIEEETRHQKNMEDITTKAFNQLNDDADPHAIDNDWITKFFNKCRLISDDETQDLWGSILAGEANRPGSYSPKTLTTLADMDQTVAMLFNAFCSLCIVRLDNPHAFLRSPSNFFKIQDARVICLPNPLTDLSKLRHFSAPNTDEFAQKSESIYQEYGFNLNDLQLLSEYGLIQDSTLMHYSTFWYNNELWGIQKLSAYPTSTSREYQDITIPGFALTSVGKELFHITQISDRPGYFKSITNLLQIFYNVKVHNLS